MGQSFKTYKDRILLSEMLDEIFDSEPFKNNFNFKDEENGDVKVESFKDPLSNKINIVFYNIKNNLYELDFGVNGNSFSNFNLEYSLKDYSLLLSTIAQAVSQFLERYKPKGLKIEGEDSFEKIIKNPDKDGQKNSIYKFFISQIEDKGDYMVDKSIPKGIALMRK